MKLFTNLEKLKIGIDANPNLSLLITTDRVFISIKGVGETLNWTKEKANLDDIVSKVNERIGWWNFNNRLSTKLQVLDIKKSLKDVQTAKINTKKFHFSSRIGI